MVNMICMVCVCMHSSRHRHRRSSTFARDDWTDIDNDDNDDAYSVVRLVCGLCLTLSE